MPEPPMMPRTALVMGNSECQMANREDGTPRRQGAYACSLFATRYSPLWLAFHRHLAARGFGGRLLLVPYLLLGQVHEDGEDDQEDDHLEADALARLEMRLRSPH